MKRHLIVFAKTPIPGQVKTRLCPPLSREQAAALAEGFLRDVLALGESLPGHERALAYAPRGTRERMRAIASGRWRLRLQRGADLGQRLEHALTDLLSARPSQVLVLGSDSPQLPPERLQQASNALDCSDLVLGPAVDGGYYLIGLRRWAPGLFDGVRWSTEHALRDTLDRAEALGLSWTLLREDYDVDDIASLRRLARDLRRLPRDRLPHTRNALLIGAASCGD